MATVLSKQRDYKDMAAKYSNLNDIQMKYGKKSVAVLDIKPGEKVLDMGCGTGELTTYIAAQVSEEGRVVGVDPDEEKIKVATQKHLNERALNLDFVTGDSSTHFPHFNEEYYDVHFSNCVFHWLSSEEKAVYLKAAMKCLKPGGRITFDTLATQLPEIGLAVQQLVADEQIESNRSPFHLVDKATMESMLKDAGFEILSSEHEIRSHIFPSVDNFIIWFCVSNYFDETKIVPGKKKAFAKKYTRKDGTILMVWTMYKVVARKELPLKQ